MSKNVAKARVIIEFDSVAAAEDFSGWMCNQGEQDYWQSAEVTASEDPNFKYPVEFNYGKIKNGDITVTTVEGRNGE